MARSRPSDGLERLTTAASRVFAQKGFAKASMADVAEEMGVSYGLPYTYVESKEALLHVVIERIAAEQPLHVDLPIRTPLDGETARLANKVLRHGLAVPSLDAALALDDISDALPELEAIIREHYAGVARYRELLAILERSSVDLPELRKGLYVKGRRPFVHRLAQYLDRRIATGRFRNVPDTAVTARFIVESVAWFANHRHGDLDSASINNTDAETTVVDMLLNGLRP